MLVDAECKINLLLVIGIKEIGYKEQKIFLICFRIPFIGFLMVSKNVTREDCRFTSSCISVFTEEGFSSIPLTMYENVKLLKAEERFEHYLNMYP